MELKLNIGYGELLDLMRARISSAAITGRHGTTAAAQSCSRFKGTIESSRYITSKTQVFYMDIYTRHLLSNRFISIFTVL